jgi:hypothetical protein
MKCFQHNETDAIGICRHCHKGVCRQCAAVVDGCLACRYVCELKVEQANRMIAFNAQIISSRPRVQRAWSLVSLLAGAVLVGMGLRVHDGGGLVVFGIMLGVFGVFQLLAIRTLSKR